MKSFTNFRHQFYLFMKAIKFGTDGWRAIIAEDYTIENVRRISTATALWMLSKNLNKVVIGHDCRFGGRMFMEETARVLASHGIKVLYANIFVSTPMVSLGVIQQQAGLGIVITASHNPPLYNGFKLKSAYGGPTIPSDIAAVESLIPDYAEAPSRSFAELVDEQRIESINLEDAYFEHVKNHFNIELLRKFQGITYDAMYGAGQRIMKRVLPDLTSFHCEYNPGFNHIPPEPISKNLTEIMQFLATDQKHIIGIANDGDADRIAMLDKDGNMIDSHHILLLLIYYLFDYKKMSGKIIVSFSVTNKVKKLADHFGLETIITKIGFKYIAELMIAEDVLVAGEESGGLAIKGHIPERDGVWIGLTILEFIAATGKSINQLIQEIYEIVGSFSYDRLDIKLEESKMIQIKSKLSNTKFENIGGYKVKNYENLDGEKYYFDHESWIMYRLSGTEPVLRIYAQGRDTQEVKALLQAARVSVDL